MLIHSFIMIPIVNQLMVCGAIGEEGWQALGEALERKPNAGQTLCRQTLCPAPPEAAPGLEEFGRGRVWAGVREFEVSRQELAELCEAGRESIKSIWDATKSICIGFDRFDGIDALPVSKSQHDWESAWTRLQQISAMTDKEFSAEISSEEEEDEEGDSESGDEESEEEEDDEEEEEEDEN